MGVLEQNRIGGCLVVWEDLKLEQAIGEALTWKREIGNKLTLSKKVELVPIFYSLCDTPPVH